MRSSGTVGRRRGGQPGEPAALHSARSLPDCRLGRAISRPAAAETRRPLPGPEERRRPCRDPADAAGDLLIAPGHEARPPPPGRYNHVLRRRRQHRATPHTHSGVQRRAHTNGRPGSSGDVAGPKRRPEPHRKEGMLTNVTLRLMLATYYRFIFTFLTLMTRSGIIRSPSNPIVCKCCSFSAGLCHHRTTSHCNTSVTLIFRANGLKYETFAGPPNERFTHKGYPRTSSGYASSV